MKIIQIMPEFGLAGAERMCETLTLELAKRGHDIQVVSLFDFHSSITDNLENNGIKITYLNKKKGFDLSMISKLCHIFGTEKPDVIHTHRYVCKYAIPASILTGVKGRVHTVHNIAEKERTAKKLQHFFYHHCNTVPVSISPIVQKSVMRFYNFKAEQTPMIFNGSSLNKCKTKINYDICGSVFNFLHIGRFTEQKNHKNLVYAFKLIHKKYPHTKLTMLGEGPLFDEIKRLADENNLSEAVVMPGAVDNVYSYFEKADAFVLPSNYEGMPISLIEAMSCGMPIIASSVGGVPDMIKDGETGLLCTPDNLDIENKMRIVYENSSLRKKIGIAAKVKSADFTVEQMTSAYEKVYSSTVKDR